MLWICVRARLEYPSSLSVGPNFHQFSQLQAVQSGYTTELHLVVQWTWLKIKKQVLCSVNYHASWNCRFLSTSLNRSGGIDGLGLGIESLALRCLTIHRAEAFDAQLLPGLCHCGGPSGDVLVGFLAGSMLLLGHNLVTLVLQQVCLYVLMWHCASRTTVPGKTLSPSGCHRARCGFAPQPDGQSTLWLHQQYRYGTNLVYVQGDHLEWVACY